MGWRNCRGKSIKTRRYESSKSSWKWRSALSSQCWIIHPSIILIKFWVKKWAEPKKIRFKNDNHFAFSLHLHFPKTTFFTLHLFFYKEINYQKFKYDAAESKFNVLGKDGRRVVKVVSTGWNSFCDSFKNIENGGSQLMGDGAVIYLFRIAKTVLYWSVQDLMSPLAQTFKTSLPKIFRCSWSSHLALVFN